MNTDPSISEPAAVAAPQNGAPAIRAVREARPEAPRRAQGGGFNWFRFWMQMLAAMVVFNIVAGLLTWYYIFPKLHPAH